MRQRTRHLILGTSAAAVGITGTMTAFAGGSVPGTADARAGAAAMPRGATPQVEDRARAAMVRWSAQAVEPGVPMDHYVVTAHSLDNPARPDVTHTVTADGRTTEQITFTAGEVAGGDWYWTVIPKFRQWAGAESPRSEHRSFVAPAVPRVAENNKPAPNAEAVTNDTISAPARRTHREMQTFLNR